MDELVQLSNDKHLALKVRPEAYLETAVSEHALTLQVAEIGKAISSFPVFFTRIEQDGRWAVSAMASLEVGSNLFCSNSAWSATYMPSAMRTYPLFLMISPEDENKPVIGLQESNKAFSKEEGEALFDTSGKPSLYQTRVKAQLDANLKDGYHTHQFFEKLQELDLIKAMDIKIFYVDNKVNTLKGLHTINEEKLHALSSQEFEGLRKDNYLPPIYAMLMSIFQLNNLIGRHNKQDGVTNILQVKMEAPK